MTGFNSKRQMAQDKEALKLALNALETADETEFWNKQKEAIAAIKEALAQPAQEPVAWGFRNDDGAIYDCISPEAHAEAEGDYTVPLYTTPQQRPWVGLTDKEILADETLRYYFGQNGGAGPVSKQGRKVVNAIEAALRSKNT